jgi:hypothetical protein
MKFHLNFYELLNVFNYFSLYITYDSMNEFLDLNKYRFLLINTKNLRTKIVFSSYKFSKILKHLHICSQEMKINFINNA